MSSRQQEVRGTPGLAVLRLVISTLEEERLPFCMIGSIAAATIGDAAWPNEKEDIDVFVPKHDAERARNALVAKGFTPDDAGPEWLLKAWREGILVDLIFRPSEMEWDEDIESHIQRHEFRGLDLPIISPEDYVVMQAVAFSEETPQYLFNGLGVLRTSRIDWDYLLRRTRDPDRMLAMLFFARAHGLEVPERLLRRLLERGEVSGAVPAAS